MFYFHVAYPREMPGSVYAYNVQAGQSITMTCPFPIGALRELYSHRWIRGFSTLSEDDPRFIFNHNTFEITVVSASVEDSRSDYVCQVTVDNPLGNDWIVWSQPISLNVTNVGECGTIICILN